MSKRKNQQKREPDFIQMKVNHFFSEINNEVYRIQCECLQFGQSLTSTQFTKKWLFSQGDQRTNIVLSGGRGTLLNSQQGIKVRSTNVALEKWNLFGSIQWNYKITNKFCQNATLREDELVRLLAHMKTILCGYFSQSDPCAITRTIPIGPLGPLQSYFCTTTDRGYSLIWEVGVDKIPKLKQYFSDLSKCELIGFEYLHTITFLDIRYDQKIDKILTKIIKPYHTDVMGQHYRQDFSNIALGSHPYTKDYLKKRNMELLFTLDRNDLGNLYGELNYPEFCTTEIKWLDQIFPIHYLIKEEQNSIIYDQNIQRWVNKDYEALQEAKAMREYQAKINKDLLKRYADFSSAAKLVELLQKIPNFKIKLTEQEQEVVGSDGHVMVIGRSGTGKTTCAILRLFAMETLFKLRLNLYKQRHENILQNYKQNDEQIDNNVGLHCIFATASPVLTTEIKRYYQKLTEQIKNELEKKRQKERLKRLQQQQENLQNQFEQSTVQIIGQDEKQIEEQYFEKQIGGIKLQEEQGGFQEEIDEEDWEKEEEKLKKELDVFNSFKDMKDKDFPAFLTIKKLILLIDGSLINPFFSRSKDNKIIGSDNNAQWSNESNAILFINQQKKVQNEDYESEQEEEQNEEDEINVDELDEQQLEQEYQRQLYLMNRSKMTTKLENTYTKVSQEVDFEFFQQNFFYSKHNKYANSVLKPNFVWTQIYSNIKGSAQAHSYPGRYVPKSKYLKSVPQLQIFEEAFECFICYERWKLQYGYYDFTDVVNHILIQLNYNRVNLIPIHYLMIDEVQDLSYAMLLLLCKVTEQGLFFSGDTAQNIAKGVGFRFQDLKSLFIDGTYAPNLNIQQLNLHQLTVNFRSHNNILQIANSIVTLIELFFPKTIDKLQKERSDINGPKPIIVKGGTESLFYLLTGEQNDQNKVSVGNRLPIEFGCNQVVIVKDQASKKKIPSILQHALVLTIYEAKGLEFDDVILFNFFQDNQIEEYYWKILTKCDIETTFVTQQEYEQGMTKHNRILNDVSDFLIGSTDEKNKVQVKRIINPNQFFEDESYQYQQICNELKQLYVAVTRPRQRLIIYDENPSIRQYLEKIWIQLDLVDFYTENIEQGQQTNVERIAKQTSPQEWKKQGIKMFRNKFYEQAEKCFLLANEDILNSKAKAYRIANEGHQLIQQAAILTSYNQKGKEVKEQIKSIKLQTKNKFNEAAHLFSEINIPKQAAQCFFSGESYEKALLIYDEQGMYNEAGEAAYKCEKYIEAAEYFLKVNDIIRTIDSLEKAEDYEGIFKALHSLKEVIPVEQRSLYLRKYLPIVLNKMSSQIGQLETLNTKKDADEAKNKQNFILEEEEDEDSDEDEENEEEDNNKIQTNTKQQKEEKQEQIEQDQSISLIDHQIKEPEKLIELSNSAIQELKSQQPSLIKQESMNNNSENSESFSVQNSESFQVENSIVKQDETQSFQVENSQIEQQNQNYDHLSQYDPEDQWLQNDNKSIIESIVSKKSDSSDFSAFAYAQIQNNPNVQFLKTKADIFIQDSIMQQIIKYISMFSDEFKFELFNQRSKSAQLSNKQIDQNEFDYMVDFILDLDLVDISFIYLVLDILEQFKNYKLCIFVCNRYKLADQIGRYLVSIAATYSPIALQSSSVNVAYLSNGNQRQAQIDKGLVAAFAVHNVFENISPQFLLLKTDLQQISASNFLGIQCYQQLILLGFWKKTIFQMNISNSLDVCQLFMDFKNWKFIYYTNLTNVIGQKLVENEADHELRAIYQAQLMIAQKKLEICFHPFTKSYEMLNFNFPKNEQEIQFAIISLEQYYSEIIVQLVAEKIIPYSLFFRANTLDIFKIIRQDLNYNQNLPKLFEKTQIVINSIIKQEKLSDEFLLELCSDVTNYSQHNDKFILYQSTYLILLVCFLQIHINNFKCITEINTSTYLALLDTQKLINKIITLQEDKLQPLKEIIIRATLFFYKARQPVNTPLLKPYLNSVMLHRSSILLSGLLERRQGIQLKREKGLDIKLDDYYFADIDCEFLIAPRTSVLFLLNKKITKEIESFRIKQTFTIMDFDKIEPEDYQDFFEYVASYFYGQLKQKETQQSSITQQSSTVDELIKKDKMELQKKQYDQFQMKHGCFNDEEEERSYFQLFKYNHRKQNEKDHSFYKFLLMNTHLRGKSNQTKYFANLKALKYLQQSNKNNDQQIQHRYLIRAFLLLNYSGCLKYAYQFLNNKVEKNHFKKYQAYLQYLEFLVCQQHNIIKDSTDCFLNYLDSKSQIMPPDEKLLSYTNLILNNLVGYLLNNKQQIKLLLPFEHFIYFKNIQTQEEEDKYLMETKLNTIDDQEGLIDLFELLIELYQEMQNEYNVSILLIIYIVVLNIDELKPKLANLIIKFSSEITALDDKQTIQIIQSAINQQFNKKSQILTLNQKAIKLQFQIDLPLYQVEIRNQLNEKQQDIQYQQCLEDWEKMQESTQIMETKVHKILKACSLYNKKIKNIIPNKFNFGEYSTNRKLKSSIYTSILEKFIQIRNLLLTTFYSMLLSNPIDLHYISQYLQSLEIMENKFFELWQQFDKKLIKQDQFEQNYDQLLKDTNEILAILKIWQQNNVKFEESANKLLEKNRKLLALKWLNNKAGMTLQKIQKRKRGLKRQQILEEKKLLSKF